MITALSHAIKTGELSSVHMVRTILDRLGSDLRIQVSCALFAVAVCLVVVLVTRSMGAGGLVLSVFGLMLAGAKYRNEQASLDR